MYYDEEQTGLGFLPAATEAGAAAGGPIGAAIGGIIDAVGAILGSGIIGPPSDQTSYVPPSNSALICVCFNDHIGNYCVGYDVTSQDSLAKAVANGNYIVDVYSYYSVFLTGSLDAGASPAAQRVIQDYAKNQGVSIQRAAESLLYLCGLTQHICPAGMTSLPSSMASAPQQSIPSPRPIPSPAPIPAPQSIPSPAPVSAAPDVTDGNAWLWVVLIGVGIYAMRKQ
jgi:hypothetical protein